MAQKWNVEPFNVSTDHADFFPLRKITYASFKNISALILSTSPPGGSRSNFFTPSVPRPVDKHTTKTET